MILRGPGNTPGQELQGSHGGEGPYFVRTLLDRGFSSSVRYIRDLTLRGHSSIGDHLHENEEEVYFVISGHGIMRVDGESRRVGPGDMVLTKSGSTHSMVNEGGQDLRILVICAPTVSG